jgi:PPK2 family polyphosphate:nucleotide phosphotransferase
MSSEQVAAMPELKGIDELPSLKDRLQLAGEGPFVLDAYRADATPCVKDRAKAERLLDRRLLPALTRLHDLMMANQRHSLLVVLQGLDASGKSGTIKHVGGALNLCGTRVACFKQPDAEEDQEHFLERIRRELPDPGQVCFFDRSHYEDAIAPRVAGELGDGDLATRIKEIREFEQELVDSGTVIVKCLLQLSYDEQRERFLRRLSTPDKRWKFSESDLETRANWQAQEAAYCEVIGQTDFEFAPWFIVPADHKWYRDFAVASLLVEHLAALGEEYPGLAADAAPDDLITRLQPPH